MERTPIWMFCFYYYYFFFFFAPKLHVVIFTAVSRSVVKCRHGQGKRDQGTYHSSIRMGALGFSVLRFRLFLDWFSVFAPKNSSFCCSFRFADFTRFSIWFSVFVKNTKRVFWNFFDLLRSKRQLSSSTDLEQPRNANVIERNAKQTKCHWNNFSLVKFRSAPWEVTGLST